MRYDGHDDPVHSAIARITAGASLSRDEAHTVMLAIGTGAASDTRTAGLLAALRTKGESVDEIAGFVDAMREMSIRVYAPHNAVDTCGTGGDGSGTFNISTVAAFVAAGAGVPVAKHGNRAMSSRCGSADVLEAFGAVIEQSPVQVQDALTSVGYAFMFAPAFHPAMRFVAPVRRELGIRTVFNMLGPLLNPARVDRQVVGVAQAGLAPKIASVLREIGTRRALVVHGSDGTDELTLGGPTKVWDIRGGSLTSYDVTPEDVGLARAPIGALAGGDAAHNADIARRVFEGERGPCRDVVVLNAAAALLVGDRVESLAEGVAVARDSIDGGAALERRDAWVQFTAQTAVPQEVPGA